MPNICVGLIFNSKKAEKYLISIIIENILLLDNIIVKNVITLYYQHFCGLFCKNGERRQGVIENLNLFHLLQSSDAAVHTSPRLLRNRRGNRPGVGRPCAEVDQPEGGARSGGHHDGGDHNCGDYDYDYDGDHKIKALFAPLLILLSTETPFHSVWLKKSLYQKYVIKMTK